MAQRNIKASRAATTLDIPVCSVYRKLKQQEQPPHAVSVRKNKPSPSSPDDDKIINTICPIKARHPFWGHRRIRASLRKHHHIRISKKRVYALMKKAHLTQPKKSFRKKREHLSQPIALQPHKNWQIDMTSFVLSDLTTLYLILVIDVFSRKIVGWNLSRRCRAKEWIDALDNALLNEFPQGVRGHGLVLRADNGSQPTSRRFVSHLQILGVTGQWIGYNCPQSNAYVERVIRTLKEEVIWPNDFDSFQQAFSSISHTISEYNNHYPHSSLLYMSPNELLVAWQKGQVSIETCLDKKGREKKRFILSQKIA